MNAWRTSSIFLSALSPSPHGVDQAFSLWICPLEPWNRANGGLTWIQRPHDTEFPQRLAAEPESAHARLDELPASRTRE